LKRAFLYGGVSNNFKEVSEPFIEAAGGNKARIALLVQDSAQLRGYAVEHRMVVLMANHASPTGGWATAGRSAIWDEHGGEVVAALGDGEAILIARREGGVLRGELICP
jgi:predicted amidohydrolase